MRVIPAIDLKGGKCVRLLKGDFRETTEYSDDPAAVAQRFGELAVSELHLVDLDGARTGAQENTAIVDSIASASGLDIQLGGGIREIENLRHWFNHGVTRCVIGSLAVTAPERVKRWLRHFGGERIVLALDVRYREGAALLATHGWTDTSTTTLWEALDFYNDISPLHVLCTDINRDGALTGPNTVLYSEILERYGELRLQASGGIRDVSDLTALQRAGVPAAITGRALLDGRISTEEIASFPRSA